MDKQQVVSKEDAEGCIEEAQTVVNRQRLYLDIHRGVMGQQHSAMRSEQMFLQIEQNRLKILPSFQSTTPQHLRLARAVLSCACEVLSAATKSIDIATSRWIICREELKTAEEIRKLANFMLDRNGELDHQAIEAYTEACAKRDAAKEACRGRPDGRLELRRAFSRAVHDYAMACEERDRAIKRLNAPEASVSDDVQESEEEKEGEKKEDEKQEEKEEDEDVGKEAETCCICFDEFGDDDDFCHKCKTCNQNIHIDCSYQWFEAHSTCPLCRAQAD